MSAGNNTIHDNRSTQGSPGCWLMEGDPNFLCLRIAAAAEMWGHPRRKPSARRRDLKKKMAADTHLFVLVTSFWTILARVQCSRGGYHDVAFIESPQYSVALPGDSVYFSCRTNLPVALENITWLHNGNPLPWKRTTGGTSHFINTLTLASRYSCVMTTF